MGILRVFYDNSMGIIRKIVEETPLKIRRKFDALLSHSSFLILHSLLPPKLLRCFSYWYIHVGEFHLRAYRESYKSQKRVKRESDGRQKGGTWEDDPNIVNLYY